MGEALDLRMQLRGDRHADSAVQRLDQSVRKAVQPIAVLHDAFALDVVEHFADLLGREFVMIQK